MEWQKFEKLQYLCQTHEDAKSCVVLFHGYGADAQDLAGLSEVLKFNAPMDLFFPQGPISVPIGPMMSGFAWFELRVADFEKLASNTMSDQAFIPPMLDTFQQVTRWLNKLGQLYDQVYIGGFSQGAILTSHVFYRLNFKPTGLLLLSSFMISPSQFPQLPDQLKVPFYQSHGRQDPVLPVGGARKLFEKLETLGLKGEWVEFSGGHEIPMTVIQSLSAFVNRLLKNQGSAS